MFQPTLRFYLIQLGPPPRNAVKRYARTTQNAFRRIVSSPGNFHPGPETRAAVL